MPDALMLFDLLLGLAIVALAAASLAAPTLFTMIVLFIVFGLLTALAWVRLIAPDVALAEAAIGTGLTGALLLKTLHHLHTIGQVQDVDTDMPAPVRVANLAFCGMITLGLGAAFWSVTQGMAGLGGSVASAMDQSGVTHPVTGVLLNFRAYDTLMEVVVLLSAIVAVWLVERGLSDAPAPELGPIYRGFARLALPVMMVVGTYLLWAGAFKPGGAFQAGAVLGAVGLLLLLSRLYEPRPGHRVMARGAFVLGTACFALVALLVAGAGRVAFQYPLEHAKTLILLIESMVTVSIAVTLAALFHGREPASVTTPPSKTPKVRA